LHALPVEREIHCIQLDACLGDCNQCRVGHFFRSPRPKAIDRTDQRLDLDRALACESAESGQMKTSIFPTLDQTMPCQIVECTFQPAPVKSRRDGMPEHHSPNVVSGIVVLARS
jgi:hypothetical protein